MCGIVGYVGEKEPVSVLTEGLEKLEYRGYDSAGIAVSNHGEICVIKAKGRLSDLEKKIQLQGKPKGSCGIGHTRWATHGEPSDINSHPHCGKRLTVVHNGIIENYQELKERLQAKGIAFESQTDTEVIAKLLDYLYKGDPLEAIRKLTVRLKGSYALGILFQDFPDAIYALRKDSPLIIGLGEGENFIASDIPAILKYTRRYCLPEEDEIAVITAEKAEVVNIDGKVCQKEILIADWDMEAAEKGGFPHFMLKEIHEEPQAVMSTLSPRMKDGLPCFGLAELTDEKLMSFEKIHIVACGTALHAGMVAKSAVEALARVPVSIEIASEFRYNNPILRKNDLVLIISQSGETADTLAALRLARAKGIFTLAVVNVVGSSIARESDSVLYTWAGPEIAVASTKAYTVQISLLYLLAIRLGYLHKTLPESEARRLTGELETMPELLHKTLELSGRCKYLASRFQNASDLFYIGRGIDWSLAMEGSLKLKEISYIHSEAYAAGELKHGTISLVVKGTPVIALSTQKRLYEKMVSNIKEVSTRGATVLLICPEGTPGAEQAADYVLYLPETEELFAPVPAAAVLQLLAYYTAVLRGCDVDKPRNLAKSVTVE